MLLTDKNSVNIYFNVDMQNGYCITSNNTMFPYTWETSYKLKSSHININEYTEVLEKLRIARNHLTNLINDLEKEAFEKI